MKKFFAATLIAISVILLAACGGSNGPENRPPADDGYVPDPSLVYTSEFLVSCQQSDDA